ncbi:MAG TPA: hypothetical protein VLU46_06165 [Thermoanaerobaculia bacterium]|nr:hypothetical protein [Thermoanaerobaculia bacterium]
MLDGLKGRRSWFALLIAVVIVTIVRIFTSSIASTTRSRATGRSPAPRMQSVPKEMRESWRHGR